MNRSDWSRNGGNSRLRLVGVLVLLAAILAIFTPVATASTPDVQVRYATGQIRYGSAWVGTTTLLVWKSGRATFSLSANGLPSGKPANVWIYAGTCGHLGTRLLVMGSPRPPRPTPTQVAITYFLGSSQLAAFMTALAAGPISLIVGSKYRCATLPGSRPCKTASLTAPPTWRVLILVYPNAAFNYRDAAGTNTSFTSAMTDAEIATVRAAADGMPASVNTWSSGHANAAVTVVIASHPLSSISALPVFLGTPSPGVIVVTADDVRADLVTLAPHGAYDSVITVWKAGSDQARVALPYAGLALGSDPQTNAQIATAALTQGLDEASSRIVLIHEWLHGAILFLSQATGCAGPTPDCGPA